MKIAIYIEQISEILGYIGQQGLSENFKSYCNLFIIIIGAILVLMLIFNVFSKLRRGKEYILDGISLLIEIPLMESPDDFIEHILEELYDTFYSQYKEKYFFSFEILRSFDKNYLILLLPRVVYPYWKKAADKMNYIYKDISNEREKFLEDLKDNVFYLDLELARDFVLPLSKDINFNIQKFITNNNWIYSQIILRPKGQKWVKVLDRYIRSLEKGEDKIKSDGCFYSLISILKPFLNFIAGILTFLFHGSITASDKDNKPNAKFVKKIDKIQKKKSYYGFEINLRVILKSDSLDDTYKYVEKVVKTLSRADNEANAFSLKEFSERMNESYRNDILLAYMSRNVVDIVNSNEAKDIIKSLLED